MTSVTEFKAVFNVTNDQLAKAQEWLDAIDSDNAPHSLDDLMDVMMADVKAKYIHWKTDQNKATF